MENHIRYKTKQREALLKYCESMSGKHFTAKDVSEYFKTEEISIGVATVYRYLEKMVEEGKLNKYIIDESSPACFEYIDCDNDKDIHFHCKCEKCGRLIHLHCDELEKIKEHLMEEHSFLLNSKKMVFYGICAECRK